MDDDDIMDIDLNKMNIKENLIALEEAIMIKIIANDGIDKGAQEELESLGYQVDINHYQGQELEEAIRTCDIMIVRSATKIRKDLIDIALDGNLKLIIRAGVGIDNIDYEYAKEKGIEVRNTPHASSASVAELAIGHMFSLARFIGISNATMREGQWNKKQYKGVELAGKTLGLIGFGRIARETARRAAALGMHIQYTKRSGRVDDVMYDYVSLPTLIETSDFISIHVPYSKGNPPLITKHMMLKMKKDAFIINTSRGGVIAENDLLDVLNLGHLAGVGLDVFEEEPSLNQELLNHPKVSATPHIGASTIEAQKRIGEETIEVIQTFFKVHAYA